MKTKYCEKKLSGMDFIEITNVIVYDAIPNSALDNKECIPVLNDFLKIKAGPKNPSGYTLYKQLKRLGVGSLAEFSNRISWPYAVEKRGRGMLSPDGISSTLPYAHLSSHNKVTVLVAILGEVQKNYRYIANESPSKDMNNLCVDQLIVEDSGLHDAITRRFGGVHKFLKKIGIAPTVGYISPEGNHYDHQNEYIVDLILRDHFGKRYENVVATQVRTASLIIGWEGGHTFDFVVGKDLVIEVAGFNEGSNYVSDKASKYLERMDFKNNLAKKNNINFLVIYPSEIHNNKKELLINKIVSFISRREVESTPYKQGRHARGTFNEYKIVQACLNTGPHGLMPRKCDLSVYFDNNNEMAISCYSAMKQIGITKLQNELKLLPAIGSPRIWHNHYISSLLLTWLQEVFGGLLPSTTDAKQIMSESGFKAAKTAVFKDDKAERSARAPKSARYACEPDISPPRQVAPYLKAGYQQTLKSMTSPVTISCLQEDDV